MPLEPGRVAHVLASFNHGGVETLALALVRGSTEAGVRPLVIDIGEGRGERLAEFRSAADLLDCPYRPPYRLDFVGRLSRTFAAERVSAVLSYSFGTHAMVALAGWRAGVARTFVTVQGSPVRSHLARLKNALLAHLARPWCSGEIACSRQIARELRQGLWLPANRLRVISNACCVHEIASRAGAVRPGRGVADPPIVVMVGRMDDAKDQATLIHAVSHLVRQGRPVRLRLIGDGPERPAHEALVARLGLGARVAFLGSRADVPELLGDADLAVLATTTEGLPLVLVEAMSAGVPVVATDIPACREALDDGRCGLLVPARHPRLLADAMRRLLDEPALRDGFVRAAGDFVRTTYDVGPAVERYLGLLRGVSPAPGWAGVGSPGACEGLTR